MIFAIIMATSAAQARQQLSCLSGCDGVELRLDCWSVLDFEALEQLRASAPLPLIFTLRDHRNGGQYAGAEPERLEALKRIARLCQCRRQLMGVMTECSPDYLDLEHTIPAAFLSDLKKSYPGITILRSYHNFNETPKDLPSVLEQLQHPAVSVYKLATQATSGLDGLRMLNLLQRRTQQQRVVGVCVGELGQFTRVLSPVVGGAWTYAAIDEAQASAHSALGLLSVAELRTVYRYQTLHKKTALYGLIGDPVAHSVGHLYHNAQFAQRGIEAVYVKFNCAATELVEFFSLIRNLGICGLSVTMPLKMVVNSLVTVKDATVAAIGATNTLAFYGEAVTATNTDGLGALAAIKKHLDVCNKKILIIGAGGAARAIAYTLSQAGANITVINRSNSRAKQMAQDFNCAILSKELLDQRGHHFSLVVNTLPCSADTEAYLKEIVARCVDGETVAMECVYSPKATFFIRAAKTITATVIYGEALFKQQAMRQLDFWTSLQ